jgi:GT2 family glycosyltransferase
MGKVAAVIVTYNRVEKLKRVIDAVLAQDRPADDIVVVDNASTDSTATYLAGLAERESTVQVLSLATNTGGAGGFAAGMERGYQLGADYVWVMDDDGYPEPGALGALERGFAEAVDELGPHVPFACSVVKFIDGSICEMNNPVPTWDWGRLLVKRQKAVMVTSCSFVSVLIPRWVLQMYGLPYAEYFIWYDDAEYTQRVTRVCPGIQVLDSQVLHDMGVNQGVNYGMVDEKSLWKFKYGARNEGSFRLYHQGLPQYLLFVVSVLMQMSGGRVSARMRLAVIGQLLAAVRFNPKVRYPSA